MTVQTITLTFLGRLKNQGAGENRYGGPGHVQCLVRRRFTTRSATTASFQ